MDEYLKSLAQDMIKALDSLRRDLGAVRTGRASPWRHQVQCRKRGPETTP